MDTDAYIKLKQVLTEHLITQDYKWLSAELAKKKGKHKKRPEIHHKWQTENFIWNWTDLFPTQLSETLQNTNFLVSLKCTKLQSLWDHL